MRTADPASCLARCLPRLCQVPSRRLQEDEDFPFPAEPEDSFEYPTEPESSGEDATAAQPCKQSQPAGVVPFSQLSAGACWDPQLPQFTAMYQLSTRDWHTISLA